MVAGKGNGASNENCLDYLRGNGDSTYSLRLKQDFASYTITVIMHYRKKSKVINGIKDLSALLGFCLVLSLSFGME